MLSATANLGISKALCYGYVWGRGNLLVLHELADKTRIAIIGMGEGEWDGIERLWINRKITDHANANLVHFHPGTDGVLGGGLAPTSNGGNQGVDSFFALLPANVQRVTYSRLAYMALKVYPDPGAPGPELDWMVNARALKVRTFDAEGNQTGYAFSTNPAWQYLDVVLRTQLKREALVNEALTAAEKARIDFASFYDTAETCTAEGLESSVVFASRTPLSQALSQLATLARAYPLEVSGKIQLRPDKPRAVSFVLTSDHLAPGTFKAQKSQLRGAANRLVGKFRDLDPHKLAGIVTCTRNANVVTVETDATHPLLVNDTIEVVGVSDASFNKMVVVASVTDGTHFTFRQVGANAVGNGGWVTMPETRFFERAPICDHEAHQKAIGQRGLGLTPTFKRNSVELDFGNNKADRVTKLMRFFNTRNLGVDPTSPHWYSVAIGNAYRAPWELKLRAHYMSVDNADRALLAQLPGDYVTVDRTISEEFQGDYEITEMVSSTVAGGSGESDDATIDLTLKACVPEAFNVVGDTGQTMGATRVARAVEGAASALGSIPPGFYPPLTYISTANSIRWNPDFTTPRADATDLHVVGDTTVTGLLPNTSYNHYPFWDEVNQAFDMVRTGGIGNPSWAHIGTNRLWTAEQYRRDHYVLSSSPIVAATTSGGTSGGSGGGDGGCLQEDMLVRERVRGVIRAGEVCVGDHLKGRDGRYRRVVRKRVAPHDIWVLVRFTCEEELLTTAGHPYTLLDGTVCKAATLSLESEIPTESGMTYPVEIKAVRRSMWKVSITLEEDDEPSSWAHTFLAGKREPVISTHNIGIPTY